VSAVHKTFHEYGRTDEKNYMHSAGLQTCLEMGLPASVDRFLLRLITYMRFCMNAERSSLLLLWAGGGGGAQQKYTYVFFWFCVKVVIKDANSEAKSALIESVCTNRRLTGEIF
jgi:hypothetical protein